MNFLKLITVTSISFLITAFVIHPEYFQLKSPHQTTLDSQQSAASDSSRAKLEVDYQNILDLAIPEPGDSLEQWQDYIGRIKLMAVNSNKPLFRSRGPYYPFLAYLAKHKPQLLIAEIEDGNIDKSVFSLMLQMGLMNQWHDYTSSPGMFIRSTPKAILALAASKGDDFAKEQAKSAFLNIQQKADRFPISSRSLAYALDTMTSGERDEVLNNISDVDISYALTSLPVLSPYMNDEQYVAFIQKNAPIDQWRKGYVVDLALKGDETAKQQIVSDYQRSLKAKGNNIGYCVVCALALTTEGNIGSEADSDLLTGAHHD